MRWFTHKSVGVAGALCLGASASTLVAVALGSILPDVLDQAIAGRNKSVWRRIHRGTTHWLGWYLLLIVGGQLLVPLLNDLHPSSVQAFMGTLLDTKALASYWKPFAALFPHNMTQLAAGALVGDLISGLGLGAVSHVLLDALNPSGVPLSPWGGKPRLSLNLVSTGSWGERVFLVCALVLVGVQFTSVEHLVQTFLK